MTPGVGNGGQTQSCRRCLWDRVGQQRTDHGHWRLTSTKSLNSRNESKMDFTPVHRSDCPNGKKKESENTSQHASVPSFLQHEAVPTINDWRKICSVTDTVLNVEHCKTAWWMVKTIRGSGTEATLYGFFNDPPCNQSGRSNGSIEVYFQQEPPVRLRHTPGQVSYDAMWDHPILWLAPDVPSKSPNDGVLHQPTVDTRNEKSFRTAMASFGQDYSECVVPTVCRKNSNATFQLMAGLGRNVCRRRHRPNAEIVPRRMSLQAS